MSANNKLLAFGWHGGKFSHLEWLLPLLALSNVRTFVDLYGGSMSVTLNREPSPVEVYNDLNGDVVNFFRCLRDNKGRLMELISLTPFSRKEYELALEPVNPLAVSELERARRFFVRARQVRSGLATSATPGRWAYCVTDSISGVAQTTYRWLNAMKHFDAIVERIFRVQIECQPAEEVALRYDTPETLFYADPPYVHETRNCSPTEYAHEMDTPAHERLAYVLNRLQGRVALSGYDSALYQKLYRGWRIAARREVRADSTHDRRTAIEVVWANYDEHGVRLRRRGRVPGRAVTRTALVGSVGKSARAALTA